MKWPTRSQARLFGELIKQYEPRIRRAFMASVTDLQANVNWTQLIERLSAFDTEGAIKALNINAAAWNEYSREMTTAYAAAGASTAAQIALIEGMVGVRFNMSNPRAEEWIRRNVGEQIVGFTEETVAVARNIIAEGYAAGDHPRSIARDLAGRVNNRGVREGGILGLDEPRAYRLNQVTRKIRTPEGVQDLVIKHRDGTYSLRYQVNKSTADKILSAYHKGTAVPVKQHAIIERQYYNALLKHRADTVAETETGNAVMSARDEEWAQLIEAEGINPDDVIKTWQHRRGSSKYHRPDHFAMSGESVRGLNTPFVFPDGTEMQHAHDPAGGAKHTIRCGCDTEYRLLHKVQGAAA